MGRKDMQLILDIKELFLEKAIDDNVLTQGGVPPKPDGKRDHGLGGKCLYPSEQQSTL